MATTPRETPSHRELARLLADRRWILGLCRRLVAAPEDVDDLVQEAATRALQSPVLQDGVLGGAPGKEGRERRGRAWLAETARRISGERFRAARHRGDREAAYASERLSAQAFPSSSEAIERAEFRERLARHVMELPAGEREAVVLRFYDELGYPEISKRIGGSEAAVRQRVSRGLARLRERLVAEDSERRSNEGAGSDWRALAVGVLAEKPARAAAASAVGTGSGAALKVLGVVAIVAACLMGVVLVLLADETEGATAHDRIDGAELGQELDGMTSVEPAATEAREEATSALVLVSHAQVGAFIEVRIVDDATGNAVGGQPWWLLRTGKFDLSGRPLPGSAGPSSGHCYPTQEPIASGTTDAGGVARIPAPADDVVNLVTQRSGEHARGSFALEIVDGEAVPRTVRLTAGEALWGRVADDLGNPVPGAIVVGEYFHQEGVIVGEVADDGSFRVEHLAAFSHAFRRVTAGREFTGEFRPERTDNLHFYAWRSREAWRSGCGDRSVYGIAVWGDPVKQNDRTIVLPRPRSISGVVVDGEGRPVVGASVLLRRWAGARVVVDVPRITDVISEHGVEAWAKAATTDQDGAFLISVGSNGLPRKEDGQLVAVGPNGDVAFEPCAPLAFGSTRDGYRLTLESPKTLRLSLVDSEGQVRCPDSRFSPLLAQFESGVEVTRRFEEPTCEGNRLELVYWPDQLPTAPDGRIRGTMLLPGYEPIMLDLAAAAADVEIPLVRRPALSVEVDVTGAGASFVDSLDVEVAFLPAGADSAAVPRFSRYAKWDLATDRRCRVAVGEPVQLLALASHEAYFRVTLHSTYGEFTSTAPVVGPLPVSSLALADGTFGHFQLSVEAPNWGDDAAADPNTHPLAIEAKSALKVQLVDGESGEPLVPWSFRATGANQPFHGEVRHRPRTRPFGAWPGHATIVFESPHYEPLTIGPIQFSTGETMDLGTLSMTKLSGAWIQLYQPNGEPVGMRARVRVPPSVLEGWSLPEGVRTESTVLESDGRFPLDVALGQINEVLVDAESQPRQVAQRVKLTRDDNGEWSGVLHRWRVVEIHVLGLTGPARFSSCELEIRGTEASDPPALTQARSSSTTVCRHRVLVPPGTFTIAAPDHAPFYFDPVEFTLTANQTDTIALTLEIEATSR